MSFKFSHLGDYAHSHGFIFKKIFKIALLIFIVLTIVWSFFLKSRFINICMENRIQAA